MPRGHYRIISNANRACSLVRVGWLALISFDSQRLHRKNLGETGFFASFIRSAGTKRIPITSVVDHVRALKQAGATLYCWSTGGADYARAASLELGLEDCFVAFLPKPTVILDDQPPAEWRLCRHVHPFNVAALETEPRGRTTTTPAGSPFC